MPRRRSCQAGEPPRAQALGQRDWLVCRARASRCDRANGPSSVQWLLAQRKRLQERTRLVERQTRESRVQRGWIPVPKVAEEIRLDVPSGKNSCSQPKQGLPAAKNSSSTLA